MPTEVVRDRCFRCSGTGGVYITEWVNRRTPSGNSSVPESKLRTCTTCGGVGYTTRMVQRAEPIGQPLRDAGRKQRSMTAGNIAVKRSIKQQKLRQESVDFGRRHARKLTEKVLRQVAKVPTTVKVSLTIVLVVTVFLVAFTSDHVVITKAPLLGPRR